MQHNQGEAGIEGVPRSIKERQDHHKHEKHRLSCSYGWRVCDYDAVSGMRVSRTTYSGVILSWKIDNRGQRDLSEFCTTRGQEGR